MIDPQNEYNCNLSMYETQTRLKTGVQPDYIHINSKAHDLLAEHIKSISNKTCKSIRTNLNHMFITNSDELNDEENYSTYQLKPINVSLPEVKCKISNKEYNMMINTGSQATIITQDLYSQITKDTTDNNLNMPMELPVNNLSIIGVTGVRSKRIDRQVMIDIEMGNMIIPIVLLVVKGINLGILLGCDFFYQYKAEISFKHNKLFFNITIMEYQCL